MTLPSSGQLSFNDIRIELGISTQAPFSLESASKGLYVAINTNSPSYPNGTAPYAVSEWYGYDHNAGPTCNLWNGGIAFTYATTTPSDKTNCGGSGNEYTNSQILYSDDCTIVGANCTAFSNSGCTTTAYSIGIRYFTDGSNYYGLNASSVVNEVGSCTQ